MGGAGNDPRRTTAHRVRPRAPQTSELHGVDALPPVGGGRQPQCTDQRHGVRLERALEDSAAAHRRPTVTRALAVRLVGAVEWRGVALAAQVDELDAAKGRRVRAHVHPPSPGVHRQCEAHVQPVGLLDAELGHPRARIEVAVRAPLGVGRPGRAIRGARIRRVLGARRRPDRPLLHLCTSVHGGHVGHPRPPRCVCGSRAPSHTRSTPPVYTRSTPPVYTRSTLRGPCAGASYLRRCPLVPLAAGRGHGS